MSVQQVCDECEKKVFLSFKCNHCGLLFCDEHRLPESHQCPYLHRGKQTLSKKKREERYYGFNRDEKYSVFDRERSKKSKVKWIVLVLFIIAGSVLFTFKNDIFPIFLGETRPIVYFESVDDLVTFIRHDNLNEAEYSYSDYSCVEFARDFILRAEAAGYSCFTSSDLFSGQLDAYDDAVSSIGRYFVFSFPDTGHRVVKTRIGDSDIIVDPQTDIVMLREQEREWWGYLTETTFTVLYKGEVVQ